MKTTVVHTLAIVLGLLGVSQAGAEASTKAQTPRVNVYQYAVDNPVENSPLRTAPTLGASVPSAIKLIDCEDEKTYSYFYYDGHPVIVDRSTRSVVRIGQ